MVSTVCPAAVDLIIEREVTSREIYERRFSRPTWPGGDSGVTIGVGFDLGYEPVDELTGAFRALPAALLARLGRVLGIKGGDARAALPALADIVVPWEVALDAFTTHTLPRYAALTARAFPGAEAAPPRCFGALVSLVYNRGASLVGERRTEMATIRDLIADGRLDEVPAEFRAMKRLWPTVAGLRERREMEAALWEGGLAAD